MAKVLPTWVAELLTQRAGQWHKAGLVEREESEHATLGALIAAADELEGEPPRWSDKCTRGFGVEPKDSPCNCSLCKRSRESTSRYSHSCEDCPACEKCSGYGQLETGVCPDCTGTGRGPGSCKRE